MTNFVAAELVKLIQALGSRKGETIHDLIPYLDLVATAIGADIVPITGENRVLAYFGLQVINENPRAGFKAIINQIKKTVLTITDVVFIIAPRINAAGRMEHGQYAVNLLTEKDANQAQKFAAEIGIVASRLTDTYYRPTLVFTKSGDKLAASARSVKGFDVYNALEGCADYIEQFGGHKYAAGLTLLEEQYNNFKAQFEKVVAETIDPNLLIPEITVDMIIELKDITPKLMRIINQFAPFGPGNMTPVFMAEKISDSGYAKRVGEDEKHLKCAVTQNDYGPIGCIGFNLGDKLPLITSRKPFSAVFTIDENEWQGNVSLQLKLKDLR